LKEISTELLFDCILDLNNDTFGDVALNTELTRQKHSSNLAILTLFLGAVCIAFSPIFVRLSEVGPSATAFWRVFLAIPVLWGLMERKKRKNPQLTKPITGQDYLALMIPGLFFTGDLALWHWSIKFTTVANSTLLANFAPVFVTLGGWLLFRRRFTKTFLLGMIVGLAGTILLMRASIDVSGERLLGDLLGVGTAVFYGGYILAIAQARKKFSTAMILTWTSMTAAFGLFIVSLLSGEVIIALTLKGWLVLLGLAMVSQVFGQGLITFSLASLPAGFSSVTLLLQPFLAAIFAWFLFSESISGFQAVGGVIILLGIYTARRGSPLNT